MSEESLAAVNILVVDDEPFSLKTVESVLEGIGIGEVLTAPDGAAALDLLASTETELHAVICDIEMPELTGYEFVRRLRYGAVPQYKDVPVLMLTGHDTPKNLRRARTHRIDGFIVKPPTADVLRREILDAVKG